MALSFPQGALADQRLQAHGLTLTQGGEPTFVPADHSKPEWNSLALGEEKLLFARRLARHLALSYLPGAVVLQSFGKQYPGEPLPRWRLGLYRARHPEPLWSDLARIRLDQPVAAPLPVDAARAFLDRLRQALGLAETILPAYENIDELIRLTVRQGRADPLPRFSRRKRRFELRDVGGEALTPWEHLFAATGYLLPLGLDEDRWITAAWPAPREEGLLLMAGDSPIGLRLPLHILPPETVRTALTAEMKQGELVLFLPPLPRFAGFCALVRVVEKILEEMGLPPVVLEGYPPPDDPALASIGFMADPGVIEVNLPPTADWPEFEALSKTLFAAAHESGLQGFKYDYSGRRTGTGGGAHIILGGACLADNPFVQRPSLLSSFLRFIQNHPSISYLFTGAFAGPSSQAPRVDESAFEVPYELEITLQALERMESPGDPRMIDAMLRNLLLDWNGNTHRAEISIDKFYNDGAPNGRQGLVEFRAFEMMPTAEMFLAPNALLRALAAVFAAAPFKGALIDWRASLHDSLALPWFLWRDFLQVLDYLRAGGFDFAAGSFQAHLDFRFPVVSEWLVGKTGWELRQALEPWPVMGESAASRAVDASTDRLQLRVQGDEEGELGASVNGWRVPLVPQADPGNPAVGAIRYRLFDNPYGLQPQINAHSPLRFEIFDLPTRTIAYAFEYLNWRPGGGGYPGLPASAEEARQRVRERLRMRMERCGAQAEFREPALSPLTPYTLDLRAAGDAGLANRGQQTQGVR